MTDMCILNFYFIINIWWSKSLKHCENVSGERKSHSWSWIWELCSAGNIFDNFILIFNPIPIHCQIYVLKINISGYPMQRHNLGLWRSTMLNPDGRYCLSGIWPNWKCICANLKCICTNSKCICINWTCICQRVVDITICIHTLLLGDTSTRSHQSDLEPFCGRVSWPKTCRRWQDHKYIWKFFILSFRSSTS